MNHIYDYKLFLLVFALSASGFILQAEVYTPQNYSLIPPSPEVALFYNPHKYMSFH